MGAKFCKGTVYKTYAPYITPTDPTELKETWPLIKIFKLKKLFQTKSLHIQQKKQRYLDYDRFIEMFSQFNEEKLHTYTEKQRRRLFNLFDKQGEGRLVWSDFFTGLTLSYYACPQILAALLFALYDQKLKLVLSKDQIQNLLQNNSRYLKEKGEDISQVGLQIGFIQMNISQWIQQSTEWINYDKFRQVFGVFIEEQMEKELGQNFNELNQVYVISKQKYVGYLVNRKWFESWRIFLLKEYGIELSGYGKFQAYTRTSKTIKTLRTKKSIRSLKSSKTLKTVNSGTSKKKITDAPRLKKFILPAQLKSNATHYSLIHANIGDRPRQIRNNTLQGEFSQILAPGLIENIDYVIVSEQIWGKLKLIYGAYPEFRRSGESEIEIYPKTVKLYTHVRKGIIDFEDQKLCQFSSIMQLKQLLGKALGLEVEQLDDFFIFIKSFSINQWEIVQDLKIKVADISPEFLIFMAVVPRQDFMLFSQRYCHPSTDINHLHVGDECLYFQVGGTIGKKALIVSQTRRKVILHLKGTSYINDLCLDRQIFLKRIGLIKKQNLKKVRMEQHHLSGISDGRGLDFINCVLLVLFNNQQLVKCLQQLFHGVSRPTNIGQYLTIIYKMLSGNDSPKTIVIADFVRIYFANFLHFQLTMSQEFLHQILEKLHKFFSTYNKRIIDQYRIETQSHGICVNCSCINSTETNYFLLCVPINEEELLYYQVIYVPYNYSVSSLQHIRIAFTLPRDSTFKQYRQAFEKAAELKGTLYVLVEVQGHDIIKNYHNTFAQATLQQLMLREQDTIYAYEICIKMDSFITDHYTTDPVIKPRSLKEGQLIDFVKKSPLSITQLTNRKLKGDEQEERFWNFGKIVSIDNEKYTHKLTIRIQYRQKRGEILQIQVNPESQAVAPFPTQSFKFSQNYHLRCVQRVYNEASNQMELVNIPFVIMVSNWMRMKEIQLIVYQQLKDMIGLKGRFRIEQSQSSRMGKKQRIKKFREYLNKYKPYSIRFTDLEGRCAFCYKLQKQKVLESQEEFVCEGNEQINAQQPIFWTLKPYQIKICIDWKSPFQFYEPKPSDHSSVADVYASRKESMQTLYSCIEDRFNCAFPAQCSQCNEDEAVQSWQQSIVNSPKNFVILLDRINEETKKISKKLIHFQTQEMVIGNIIYQLTSAIALNTNKKSLHPYLVYIRDKTRWLQYEGEIIRVVKKTATIQRICALTLFYNKVGFRQKVDTK